MNERGVVIIAVGHRYYGTYANQLAMSIKAVSPETKVAIAHAEGSLSHIKKNVADQLIEIPKEYTYTNGLKDYLKAKVYLYNISPFDETIYIDADVIWCPRKPITELFEKLKDVKFTCGNRSKIDIKEAKKGFIHWADPQEIREKMGINDGILYNLSSEFMYFKKCDEVELLFLEAQNFYENPPIDFFRFGMNMPDELAFEIAILKTGLEPHQTPFIPFYWEHYEKKAWEPHKIYENFYGLSIGGNITDDRNKATYNALANNYCKKFGIRNYFPVINKNSDGFLAATRSKI